MTARYYLSDPHLGHTNIIKFRKDFNTSEEHDAHIKKQYHTVVRPNDHVYFLGDVAFTKEALEDLKTWNGIKHIILGNHDLEKKRNLSITDLQEVFEDRIQGFMRQGEFWLSHCPIHSTELRGRKNLHGHTHSHILEDSNYLNLCMENINYTPISLERVRYCAENNIIHNLQG